VGTAMSVSPARRRTGRLRVFEDPRGALLPVELGEVGFPVQRLFVVTGAEGGLDRGGHVIPCHELMVLISGRAELDIGEAPDRMTERVVLEDAGQAVRLWPGEYIVYRLAGPTSSVLVLADRPYEGEGEQAAAS
jgi:hypothetical protein